MTGAEIQLYQLMRFHQFSATPPWNVELDRLAAFDKKKKEDEDEEGVGGNEKCSDLIPDQGSCAKIAWVGQQARDTHNELSLFFLI